MESKSAATAKQSNPVGSQPPRTRVPVAVVDSDTEIAIQVLYSTIVFRPGQVLKDKRLLEIAKEHHIPIRYKQ